MKVKRILAFVLMVVLALVPITAVSAFSGGLAELGDSSFTPRLTAPSKSNKYYYSNDNIFYSIGYGMPNCTAYAWGRAYELLGTKPKLSTNSAQRWWGYNKDNNFYPSGQTPKLGAIACWTYSGGGGHVAVVEKITSSTITMSHSAYSGDVFYLKEYSRNSSLNVNGYNFQGFIYILDGEILPEGDVYTVNSSNGVNMRKGAGTSYSVVTAVPNGTRLVVTDTKRADGYKWGKTTYEGKTGWCVLDFCTLVYQKPTTPPTTATTAPPTKAPTTATTLPPTTAEPDPQETTVVETLPTEPQETTVFTEFTEATDVTEATDATETTEATVPTVSVSRPDPWADVSGDGKTNINDATLIQKHLAVMDVALNLEVADSNNDGKISVADATYIQKVLASIA